MGGTQVLSSLGAVDVAMKTDPGRDPDKQVNEDAAGYRDTRFGFLAVMCDGMGGHAGGKEAANLALKTIFDVFDSAPANEPRGALLARSISEANVNVWGMQTAERGEHPGSTVVATLHHANGTEVAHVGDSRVYRISGGRVEQVTKDHSKVQLLVDAGYLKAEEAATHPEANQILNALGMGEIVKVDLRPEPILHGVGDMFLLCSDGLSDLVSSDEILKIVTEVPPTQACGQLVDLANARGGHDNITVVLVRMNKAAASVPLPVSNVAPTVNHGATLPFPPTEPTPQVAPTLVSPGPVAVPTVRPPPTPSYGVPPSTSLPPPSKKSGAPAALLAFGALAIVGVAVVGVLFLGKKWKARAAAVSPADAGVVVAAASSAPDPSNAAPSDAAPAASEFVPADADAAAPAPTDAVPPLEVAPSVGDAGRRHRHAPTPSSTAPASSSAPASSTAAAPVTATAPVTAAPTATVPAPRPTTPPRP